MTHPELGLYAAQAFGQPSGLGLAPALVIVDFVLGFSERWICVTAELESAVNWQEGLMQALWYRSAYFNETGLEALPCLILFGDVSRERWEEIKTTCLGQGVLLVTFDLRVQGEPAEHPLEELLSSGALFSLRSRA